MKDELLTIIVHEKTLEFFLLAEHVENYMKINSSVEFLKKQLVFVLFFLVHGQCNFSLVSSELSQVIFLFNNRFFISVISYFVNCLEEIALFNETEILLKKRESLFHCFWREFFFPKWEKIYYPGIESIDSKHYVTTLLQHLVRHCNDEEDGTMSTVMSHITITKKQYLKILQQDQALYLTWLLYFQGQMPLHCLNGAIDYHSEVLLGFEQIFASFELKLQQKTRVQFFEMLVLCITLVIIILNYVMHQRGEKGFFSEAVLFIFALSVLGIFFFLLATDFIFLYLSIELISLSLYVLVASEKVNLKSVEAGLKYFVVGSFTSLIYLLGSALLYGYFATLGI
jgi:hypothetical protein